jgi:hypothetical protein
MVVCGIIDFHTFYILKSYETVEKRYSLGKIIAGVILV